MRDAKLNLRRAVGRDDAAASAGAPNTHKLTRIPANTATGPENTRRRDIAGIITPDSLGAALFVGQVGLRRRPQQKAKSISGGARTGPGSPSGRGVPLPLGTVSNQSTLLRNCLMTIKVYHWKSTGFLRLGQTKVSCAAAWVDSSALPLFRLPSFHCCRLLIRGPWLYRVA